MDYHEIQKMTAVKLREVIGEKYPDMSGLSAKKKDELVEILADKLGIDRHAHAAVGIDKTSIKQRIRALKKERDEALAARDSGRATEIRHAIHKQKHILRRAVKQADLAAARGKS